MLHIGLVGHYGHHGYVLHDLPEQTAITAVWSDNREGLAQLTTTLAEHGQQAQVFADAHVLINNRDLDIIVISGPFHRHAEFCIAALKAGKSVYCEKPVAATMDELQALQNCWQAHPHPFASMMGIRYDQAFFTAFQAIEQGLIGDARLVHAQKSYKLGQRAPHFHTRATSTGTIPWVGTHAIDWVYWLSGKKSFKTVSAHHSSTHNHNHGDLEVSATCHFTMEDGLSATVSIDYLRPNRCNSHGDDRVRVAGTDGVIEVRHHKCFIIGEHGEEVLPLATPPGIFADFVGSLDQTQSCLIDTDDVFMVTKAALLARDAADRGELLHW